MALCSARMFYNSTGMLYKETGSLKVQPGRLYNDRESLHKTPTKKRWSMKESQNRRLDPIFQELRRKQMRKIFLAITFMIGIIFVSNVKANECRYWLAQVDANTDVNYKIDEHNKKNIIKGISCLLKMKGNKKEGLFGGATSETVSNIFLNTTIE